MEEVRRNSLQAWILAARPKTLAGTITSVMIDCVLAYAGGEFSWIPALICCLLAGLVQIAANFINDLFDFLKGTDREDRLGPKRACAQGWISANVMKKGIFTTVALACLIGCSLLLYGGWELILVGALYVLFVFLYTTGPRPLSYEGWGGVLVIMFFGFVPVRGTYYVQTLNWTPDVTIVSLMCGLVVGTLLVVNSYRDRDVDRKNGKKTVVVRFDEPFGRCLYLLLGIIAAWFCFWFLFSGRLYATLLPQFYLFFHIRTWRKMVQAHSGKKLNNILGETSRSMLLMGILLSIGLIING